MKSSFFSWLSPVSWRFCVFFPTRNKASGYFTHKETAWPIGGTILWWSLTLPFAFTASPPPLEANFSAEREIVIHALQGHQPSQERLLARWNEPPPQPHSPVSLSNSKIVAQTVTAAEILLAIAPVQALVAVPRSVMRRLELWPALQVPPSLFPAERVFSEHLFHRHPDLAVVADFSDPAMLNTLRQQRIPLHSLAPPRSFQELVEQIEILGALTGNQENGEKLAGFLRAGFKHLGRRVAHPKNLLIGGFYHRFTALGHDHLLIRCLHELQLPTLNHAFAGFFHPLELRSLAKEPPDLVILTTPHPLWTPKENALSGKPMIILDENLADSTSQWLFLALYDIAEICAHDSS